MLKKRARIQIEGRINRGRNQKEPEGRKNNCSRFYSYRSQYGNTHTLSDYRGKVVFLNFGPPGALPCRMEMPYIEEIYNDNNQNSEDVVIIGVAGPNIGKEGDEQHIIQFLRDEGYTFPSII